MKIGIVTFWTSNGNYGQLLQCWALQQQLKLMGHSPFLICYHHPFISSKQYVKRIIKYLLVYPAIRNILQKRRQHNKNKLRNFDLFRRNNIIKSDVLYSSIKDLRENPPTADCYMTGSDQGWAQIINREENKAYFLDFGDVNKKRIAYAPSFAMDKYPQKYQLELRRLLSNYNYVSVREESGVRICENLGICAVKALDPTLLLNKEYYINHLNIKKNQSSSIFVYSLNVENKDELRWGEIKKYADSKGVDYFVTIGDGLFRANEVFGDDVIYDYCSIEKWLENIYNAYAVITTSFHGVVFSIIMEKPFVFVPLKGRKERFNDRILDLLKEIGLQNRILSENTSFDNILSNDINWKMIKERIDKIRSKSISYLKSSLED